MQTDELWSVNNKLDIDILKRLQDSITLEMGRKKLYFAPWQCPCVSISVYHYPANNSVTTLELKT